MMNKINLIKLLQDRIQHLFDVNQVHMIYDRTWGNINHKTITDDEMNDLYESDKKDFIELLQVNIWTFVLNDDIKENFDIDVVEQHNEQVKESEMN